MAPQALVAGPILARKLPYVGPGAASTPSLASGRGAVRAGLRGLDAKEGNAMLWTITVLLFVLWLIGMVSNYTMGGLIHLLLLIAVVTMLIRIIQGRRPV
jgi:uncharacterized protein DUF5670